MEIKTVDAVVLSLGIELAVEDFFDPQYLVRNLASLFGIPTDRMRVPKIVAGSQNMDIEVAQEDLCENPDEATKAEILAASDDGMTVVYTNGYQQRVGFLDITDPRSPRGMLGSE